jgi:hypothetical protein
MYTPLDVLLGSDGARRLAHSALPHAPVAASSARRIGHALRAHPGGRGRRCSGRLS